MDIGDSSSDGVFVGAPPDTNGDVGPNHYVQTVNTAFAIWSKTGQQLVPPTPLNNIWKSAPNAAQFNCTTQSRGDPVVQYDPMADRWLITQFNFPGVVAIAPPFDECIAVSQTPDPTGAYYLYDFTYSATIFNDYPHFGVWPDAYYVSYNQFDTATPNTDFKSAGACAFERAKMLAGDSSARQVCFDESTIDPKDSNGNYIYGGQLPSDLDGNGYGSSFTGAPPAGEPNFYVQILDSTTAGQDKLLEFKFHVDWSNPANSTFGGAATGSRSRFRSRTSTRASARSMRSCLPQKDSPDGLDAIPDRLMYRLAYRNFGDHESLVLNHTVNVGDTAEARGRSLVRGPRRRTRRRRCTSRGRSRPTRRTAGWPARRWTAPATSRSATRSRARTGIPAIAYTARRAGDPLGQMSLGEALLFQGLGSQTASDSRWGDYSSLSVDPNGCTFWFTTEHYLGDGLVQLGHARRFVHAAGVR